jgi:hypothetical protein
MVMLKQNKLFGKGPGFSFREAAGKSGQKIILSKTL